MLHGQQGLQDWQPCCRLVLGGKKLDSVSTAANYTIFTFMFQMMTQLSGFKCPTLLLL